HTTSSRLLLHLLYPTPTRPHPSSPLFPYTTLFRSQECKSSSPHGGGLPAQFITHAGLHYHADPERRREIHVLPARVRIEVQTSRSEEHTSELQSRENLVCRLLPEKKKSTLRSSSRS